jgi:hypothetical protein
MDRWPRFIVGNVWLLMALVLYLGRVAVRHQPTRYSFFGIGGWHSPSVYGILIICCIVVGLWLMASARSAAGNTDTE